MDLMPYTCTQCGAPIDRMTLKCNHCGTEFYMNEKHFLVVKESVPGEHTIYASAEIDPYDLMHDRERRVRYAVEELTAKLADELAPYIEIEQDADPRRGVYQFYARCRVLEPHGRYYANDSVFSLHPRIRDYRNEIKTAMDSQKEKT